MGGNGSTSYGRPLSAVSVAGGMISRLGPLGMLCGGRWLIKCGRGRLVCCGRGCWGVHRRAGLALRGVWVGGGCEKIHAGKLWPFLRLGRLLGWMIWALGLTGGGNWWQSLNLSTCGPPSMVRLLFLRLWLFVVAW